MAGGALGNQVSTRRTTRMVLYMLRKSINPFATTIPSNESVQVTKGSSSLTIKNQKQDTQKNMAPTYSEIEFHSCSMHTHRLEPKISQFEGTFPQTNFT